MLEVSEQFRIGVLIPMVTTESDVVQVAERLHELAAEMGVHELPRIGAMIEAPAAALSIPCLKKHVAFSVSALMISPNTPWPPGERIPWLLSISLTTIRLFYGSSSWWSGNPVTFRCSLWGACRPD